MKRNLIDLISRKSSTYSWHYLEFFQNKSESTRSLMNWKDIGTIEPESIETFETNWNYSQISSGIE